MTTEAEPGRYGFLLWSVKPRPILKTKGITVSKKVLALKITPQTYAVYSAYPGIKHMPLEDCNNLFIVRDETLPDGVGYFVKKDFDLLYRSARETMYFTRFTECVRLGPPLGEMPEVVPPKRIRE